MPGVPHQIRPGSPARPRPQPVAGHMPSFLNPNAAGTTGPHGWEGTEGRMPSPTPTIATSTTSTTSSSMTNSTTGVPDEGCMAAIVQRPDKTWQNPTLDQMVETIQVAMMTKRDPLAPIPVQYNAYVLALIEGYSKQRRLIASVREEANDLQALREKELDEFRSVAEEWTAREKTYRAEVRRLELIIAKTSRGGMETVALARSGSLVDKGAGKIFQAKLKGLSTSEENQDTGDENTSIQSHEEMPVPSRKRGSFRTLGSLPRNIRPDQDVIMSQRFRPTGGQSTHNRHPEGQSDVEIKSGAFREPVMRPTRNTYIPTGLQPFTTAATEPAQPAAPPARLSHGFQDTGRNVAFSSSSSSDADSLAESKSDHHHQLAGPADSGLDEASREEKENIYNPNGAGLSSIALASDPKGGDTLGLIERLHGSGHQKQSLTGYNSEGQDKRAEFYEYQQDTDGSYPPSADHRHMRERQARCLSFNVGDDSVWSATSGALAASRNQPCTPVHGSAATIPLPAVEANIPNHGRMSPLAYSFLGASCAATSAAQLTPETGQGNTVGPGPATDFEPTSAAAEFTREEPPTSSTSTDSVVFVGSMPPTPSWSSSYRKDDHRRRGSAHGTTNRPETVCNFGLPPRSRVPATTLGAAGNSHLGIGSSDGIAQSQVSILASPAANGHPRTSPARTLQTPQRQLMKGGASAVFSSPTGSEPPGSASRGGTEQAESAARLAAARAVARGSK